MSPELDQQLCLAYPKIFTRTYQETDKLQFGFECGDGWYHIINNSCRLIQSHISWQDKRIQQIKHTNKIRAALLAGDSSLFDNEYKIFSNEYRKQKHTEFMESARPAPVPRSIKQLVADQIKEKFGTLRFYYDGGDDFCAGVVAMAEQISSNTCEVCSAYSETGGTGYIRTLCVVHRLAA